VAKNSLLLQVHSPVWIETLFYYDNSHSSNDLQLTKLQIAIARTAIEEARQKLPVLHIKKLNTVYQTQVT
jgi:hypothetical protein